MAQDAAQIRHEIQDFCSALLEHGLAVSAHPPIMDHLRHRTVVISPLQRKAAALIPLDSFMTVNEYRRIIRHQLYTCLLNDGGALQLSYTFRDDTLVGHRLCYYPCPVIIDSAEFPLDEDFSTILDLKIEQAFAAESLEDLESAAIQAVSALLRSRSSIRFDFDPDAAAPNHPASHLTLSSDACRVPVFAPLSVGHFVRFVFRHFYPQVWKAQSFIREWPLHRFDRCIDAADVNELFLEGHVIAAE